MSEPIPSEIWIGGSIHRELVPGLCKAIAEQGVALDWGDAYFRPETPEELLSARQDQDGVRLLCLYDYQANYGQFAALEAFLEREKVSYRRHSDARSDLDAEVVEYRSDVGQVSYQSDNIGQPLVPLSTMTRIAAAVDATANTAEGQTALELLRRLRNLQQLVHENLPSSCRPWSRLRSCRSKAAVRSSSVPPTVWPAAAPTAHRRIQNADPAKLAPQQISPSPAIFRGTEPCHLKTVHRPARKRLWFESPIAPSFRVLAAGQCIRAAWRIGANAQTQVPSDR
jgi:hypothetical protein